jgi:hypothetical protein
MDRWQGKFGREKERKRPIITVFHEICINPIIWRNFGRLVFPYFSGLSKRADLFLWYVHARIQMITSSSLEWSPTIHFNSLRNERGLCILINQSHVFTRGYKRSGVQYLF